MYPAHDYKGFTVRKYPRLLFGGHLYIGLHFIILTVVVFQVSTVGEEMLYNPRLTKDEVNI